MSGNYFKLYNASSAVESAFFLVEGSVLYYASNTDKYAISGKNLIISSTEIIMNNLCGVNTPRIETAVADPASVIKKMTVAKYLEGLGTYTFALNVSMVLAKQVKLTNEIIQRNLSTLKEDENKMKQYSVEFYLIMSRLQQEYDKRRLPWLKSLIEEFIETLTYKKGEAYYKSSEPDKISTTAAISDKFMEYERGSTICEENTPGDDMFILKSGSLDVIVHGARVASIDEPDTIIGEMALLLGEKRTATLKAKNTVILAQIKKKDLQDVALKQSNFMPDIARTLAKRHFYNVLKIDNVNKSIASGVIDRNILGKKEVVLSQQTRKDLDRLKQKIEDVIRGKNSEFLQDLIDTF